MKINSTPSLLIIGCVSYIFASTACAQDIDTSKKPPSFEQACQYQDVKSENNGYDADYINEVTFDDTSKTSTRVGFRQNGRVKEMVQWLTTNEMDYETTYQQGSSVTCHANGQVESRGEYDKGQKIGLWQYWYDNGQLQKSGHYDNAQAVGRWVWYYDNGKVKSEGDFLPEARPTGLWTWYYANGQKKVEGLLGNMSLQGAWHWWSDEGGLMYAADYQDGLTAEQKQEDIMHDKRLRRGEEDYVATFIENTSSDMMAAKNPSSIAGTYWTKNTFEAGGRLVLGANGRFDFGMAMGAMDLSAQGKWTQEGNRVTLVSDKTNKPTFRLLEQYKKGENYSYSLFHPEIDFYSAEVEPPQPPNLLAVYVGSQKTGMVWDDMNIAVELSNGKKIERIAARDGKAKFYRRDDSGWRDAYVRRVGVSFPKAKLPMMWFNVQPENNVVSIDFDLGNAVKPLFQSMVLEFNPTSKELKTVQTDSNFAKQTGWQFYQSTAENSAAKKYPKVSEMHINLSGQNIGLDFKGGAGSGQDQIVLATAGERKDFSSVTHYPNDKTVDTADFPYDKTGRWDKKWTTYNSYAVGSKTMKLLTESVKSKPVVLANSTEFGALRQALGRGNDDNSFLEYQIYHYADRVEIAPALSLSNDKKLSNTNIGYTELTLAENLTSNPLARIEINGQAVRLSRIIEPQDTNKQSNEMCWGAHAGNFLADLPAPLHVRWQFAAPNSKWHESVVQVPAFNSPNPSNAWIGKTIVALYFKQDGTLAAELGQIMELDNDSNEELPSHLRTTGLPTGISKPVCGSIDNLYNERVLRLAN